MQCPHCGQEYEEGFICEVEGCTLPADYEGWYRVIDKFTQKPTGLIQKRQVCYLHVNLLIGSKTEEG